MKELIKDFIGLYSDMAKDFVDLYIYDFGMEMKIKKRIKK